MSFVQIMLLLLPLMVASPEVPVDVLAGSAVVDTGITRAVDAAAAYQPAWEMNLRETLSDSPEYSERLVSAIKSAADASGLPDAMLWSVACQETHGAHWNKRGQVKRGGAREIGLMQIKPFWQRALKRVYDVEVDLFDLEDNLLAATYILKRGGDDQRVMLSYYNTGQRISSTPYQRSVMQRIARLSSDG